VRHLARAFIRTLQYLNAHTPEEIAALMPAADVGPDRETYLATLRESMQMFATDGLMADDAARKELEVMSAFDPKFKGVRIEDTYTNRFAEAVLKESAP
jgi:NitT/TauT family transport system substrate-binding protein